jgi:hypothetical protein
MSISEYLGSENDSNLTLFAAHGGGTGKKANRHHYQLQGEL